MSIWSILFGWPDGICTGNLIASAIWGAPALLHLHWRISRNHREIRERVAGPVAARPAPFSSVAGQQGPVTVSGTGQHDHAASGG